jgi:hypothetical protein
MVNGCWSLDLHWEDAQRHSQSVFAPSSPPLPEWILYTPSVLLFLQLVVSAIGIWQVQNGRWWLATILLLFWVTAFIMASTTFG